MAGIIAGKGFGVAKGARVWAGRVVNCEGDGVASMAIAGMDWITPRAPGVVNMSLGYGDMQSVRDAAGTMIDAGHFLAAAAGNGNLSGIPQDACLESPAGQPKAMTVGATGSTDQEMYFSNYGTCVDILAPGGNVRSAWFTSDTASMVRSGTSMAAPHVAGAAALYLEASGPLPPFMVRDYLWKHATEDRITLHWRSAANGTPNRLLYARF